MQQQALRDFARAMTAFFDLENAAGHRRGARPGGMRGSGSLGGAGGSGMCGVCPVGSAKVWVPKAGWVRFRWSRAVPPDAKSYRVTMDRAGRWHIAFAVIPEPVPAPGNGQAVGIDRGVVVSAALSTGELLHVPGLTAGERIRLRRLAGAARPREAGLEPPRPGEARDRQAQDPRDGPAQGLGGEDQHGIARCFDVIRVEDLKIGNMTRSARGTRDNPGRNVGQKAGLNRGILRSGWGLLVRRAGGESPGPGREDQPRVYEPAVLGVRAGGWGVA